MPTLLVLYPYLESFPAAEIVTAATNPRATPGVPLRLLLGAYQAARAALALLPIELSEP